MRRKVQIETSPGTHSPQAWRSSWLRRDVYPATQNIEERFQLVARHFVAPQTVSIVRRVEVGMFELAGGAGKQTLGINVLPDWWHQFGGQPGAPEWDWQWNLGRLNPNDVRRQLLPGAVLTAPIGWMKSYLSFVVWEFADNWQRLCGIPQFAVHHTDTRFVVQGPSLIWLATVASVYPHPNPQQPPFGTAIPFGQSFGALEGIDLPAEAFHASPARWLIP